MANNVNINTNSNKVNVVTDDNRVTITTDTKVVNVTEEVNRVIEVITRGPQGPKGTGGGSGTDLNALTTASVENNIITFTKGSGDQFNIRVDNVKLAQTASYILADNIQQPFTSVEATSLTGSLDYSYIENVPDFVDTTGEIEENQIAIFAETFNGIPESLPFSLPLENDGHPTIKGVSGLTFDGSLFRVQGIITGSNIPPNLINLQGNAAANQLLKFVDTTDPLPVPLPFYLPVNDGNPTVEAVPGLSMINNKLVLEGNISASGYISASTFHGDGSNLTGVGSNPFPYTGNAVITGSVNIGTGTGNYQIGSNPILSLIANNVIVGNNSSPTLLFGSTVTSTNAITSSLGFMGDVVGNLTGTASWARDAIDATNAINATSASKVYVDYGATTTTAQLIPTYTADGGTDGYKDLKVSSNPLTYYYRTTNDITGVSNQADELHIGGGTNTAGAIFLNSLTGNYPTYIRSDNNLHLKTSTTSLKVVSSSPFNISSSLYVDGIVDVEISNLSIYNIGSNESIIFCTYTGATNGTGTIYLPRINKNNHRQIRVMTDNTITNITDVTIYPNSADSSATIDGAASFNMNRAYDGVMLMSHNGNWWIIQRKSK